MDAGALVDRMEAFGRALRGVVAGVSAADARWKPPSGAWSILEIVNHLADEEVEDFRTRLRLTLSDPSADWPGIDPEGWAVQRKYNSRDLDESVARFVSERSSSIAWLRSLGDADWDSTRVHPSFGEMKAGSLLASWAAHDQLHLRQIAKRLFELCGRDAGHYSPGYAGPWGP